MKENITQGKAVSILHTFKDSLWSMGSKANLPEPTPFTAMRAKPDVVESNGPSSGALSTPSTAGEDVNDLPPLIPGASLDERDIPPLDPGSSLGIPTDDVEEEKFSMTAEGQPLFSDSRETADCIEQKSHRLSKTLSYRSSKRRTHHLPHSRSRRPASIPVTSFPRELFEPSTPLLPWISNIRPSSRSALS